MKLLVVGGGGREHAVIQALRKNPAVTEIFALPGNGGIAADAVCVPIKATEIEKIAAFAAEQQVDYAVVTPDDPLVLGCVDALEARGIPCFGPRANAAIIEGSKVFSKELMKKYHIPTADYAVFTDLLQALRHVEQCRFPTVIKADGLALGKGVVIARTLEEARAALYTMMEDKKFGKSGERVVIEEYLEGPEVSVLTFTDGETLVPMVASMDHKRVGDDDTGPNTGGMGAVAPNPYYTEDIARVCMDTIFLPTIRAMQAEGRRFQGCLYFGLMLTQDGPKVIEYNCRFGDPETQAVLPLLESDLLTVMQAVTAGKLAETPVVFSRQASCCLVLASRGYPQSYETGFPITIPAGLQSRVFSAGTALKEGQLVTSGGRVLGVTALAPTLEEAVRQAYADGAAIAFEGKYCRHDIGRLALRKEQ